MKSALEHMEAAVREIEQKIAEGHVSAEDGKDAIEKIRLTYQRLTRLEEKLNVRPPETS